MKTKLLRLLVVMTISITALFALGMTASAEVTAYNIADGNINITAEGDYSISGSGTNAKITIDCSGVVNIKFENLSLKCTSYQGTMMEIKNGTVNIELDGENILQAHQDSGIYPCVSMSENAELHFYDSDSNGSITIHGTSNYHGGGAAVSGGSLYVHSGSINLVGGNKIQNNYGKSFDGKVLNIEGGSLSFAGGLISSVGNGYISVSESLVIGEGASFTVSSSSTVEIMSTASATINGTVINNGDIVNSGTINGDGEIIGNQPYTEADSFIVTGGVNGTDYEYATGVLTIKTATPVTIANKTPSTPTTDTIVVADGVSANITLAGVNIDVSGTGDVYSATPGLPALKIADNSTGNVTITLADSTANTLKSGPYYAGLHKSGTNGSLVISGGGILNTTGGQYGAGIGGGYEGIGSNITISGGVVTATGGWFSAGIGGGLRGSGSNITISGGTVTATGDNESAGIGGGSGSNSSEGNGSNITISGGTVTAAGGEGAAGIGGGIEGDAENIIITGGSVKAVAGVEREYDGTTYSPAAIGQGVQFDVDMWAYSNGAEVTPTDGNGNNVYLLELTSATSSLKIDGKDYPINHGTDGKAYVYLTEGEHTIISDGNSTTNKYAKKADNKLEAVGTAFTITGTDLVYGTDYTYPANEGILTILSPKAITIANKTPSTPTTDRIEVATGISANITLTGVNIDVSSKFSAVAFKIADNSTGDVTITLADGTTNTLKSGENRAGLQKNGGASTGMLTIQGETAGTGVLNATGGDYGAGIGSSFRLNASNITISGGTVTAQGGEGAAGIGSQQLGLNYNITISGGSVKASSIGCTPTNGTNSVYLLTIANPESETVYIDGVEYTPVNHTAAEPADTNLYVYLPAKTVQSPNEVTVGNETTKYTYDTANSRWITIVDAPEADNTEFTYDGEEHTYTLAESDCYTIISNKQTAAGTYTVIVILKENCVWGDGTTADKTYTFIIAKADPVITVTTDKPSDIAGKAIAVTTTAKHPTNEALTNIPAVTLTYKVGANGAETYFEGSFTIPEGTANGTEIIITAKTSENENYNAATATARVIVTDCEHTDKTTTWTSDDISHWHVCNYCDAEVDKAEHDGGTADCVNKAVCSVCNTSYGEKDSTNHVSKSAEWTADITGHWHNCDCGKLDYAEHVSGGAATATTPETCTICGYEIAPATGDDDNSGDGGVVTPITPPSSVKPGWGAAENANTNTTTTTTTEASKAPVEDEEIEDDIDDEEIEDDIDDDTDTTKPADDDEDDVYDDDLVGGDDCRHDEDEEDERVEENDDEASVNEENDNEESNVGNGIVSGDGDPNPETGVMVCFGGAIVSAIAVIVARKRKNK